MKKKVLFLCTANSCRSQMAEGITNHFLGDRLDARSAGTMATVVHPLAIAVLKEIGIDISSHRSKDISEFDGERFDHVITLCGSARDRCPLFVGGVRTTHIGFDDPAGEKGTGAEVVAEFRRVRDDIRNRLLAFFHNSDNGDGQ